jgi:tetratricopeptide (TPR) repeat protein
MTDSTGQQLDRYVRGDLTAAEARELARKSLDDPDLFEDLTASALAAAALSAPSATGQLEQPKIVRFPRLARFVIAGAAAAAIVLVLLYLMSPSLLNHRNPSHEATTTSHLNPALASSASPGQPILLASGLQPQPNSQQVFRSPELDSRAPRPTGSIVLIEDGLATINLGSLDGLSMGNEVRIFRHERPIGRLTVTVVFRERARGRILSGPEIQVNDRVRPPSGVYLDALMQQVDALSGRGDADAARRMAEKAAESAEAAGIPPSARAKALAKLAALELQAGLLPAAEKHYQSALAGLNAEPQASFGEQSVVLNNLAVLHMLRGDYDGAEAPLSRAVSTSPKTDIAYPRSLNNLGVLSELRGDRRKAEALYADALRAPAGSPAPERQALESNLARVRGVR